MNSYVSENERRIPYRNMVYIGDGITDVPCMTVVKDRGGHSIAIYQNNGKENAYKLIRENRVDFIADADYSKDSELEKIVKQLINKMIIVDSLEHQHDQQLSEAKPKNEVA